MTTSPQSARELLTKEQIEYWRGQLTYAWNDSGPAGKAARKQINDLCSMALAHLSQASERAPPCIGEPDCSGVEGEHSERCDAACNHWEARQKASERADGVMVPREPTEAMREAGFNVFLMSHDLAFKHLEPIAPIWKAMLSAAPAASVSADVERYQHVRRLNVPEFKALFIAALKRPFDELVDEDIAATKDAKMGRHQFAGTVNSIGCKLCGKFDIDPIHETPPSTRDALPEREKSVSADARDAGFVKPDNDRQVFFYERDFYVLSNFSAFSINWQGRIFPTSEHAYHWEKFLLGVKDGTVFVRDAILGAVSAHEAFKMAERWKPLRREDWGLRKVDVMREILRAKVDQHEYVKRKLLATGDRELIEDSWRDDFWGWGANRTGQNMLGKLWMEIRRELKDAAMEKK